MTDDSLQTPLPADPEPPAPADAPAAESEAAEPEASVAGRRAEFYAFLELFALCGFVVVQPVLDIIGGEPTFFIFHGVSTAEILLLVALFTLVPPATLWGLGALSGLAGPRVRRAVHLATLGLLLVALAIQIGKHLTPVRGAPLAGLAVVAAAVFLVCYWRWQSLRQLARFAAVGPVVFALLFTFASPASAVILAGDEPGAAPVRATGPHPPVVMLFLDEFPLLTLLDEDAEIDAERFPNFARLAEGSTWYRNATTVNGFSPLAIPAMLTGNRPTELVAPHYSQYPDNLFTLFGQVYEVEANESLTQLCPPDVCRDYQHRGGLPAALAELTVLAGDLLSPVERERALRADFEEETAAEAEEEIDTDDPMFLVDRVHENQPARFQDFLGQLAEPPSSDAPTLHFLHLVLPHVPYVYLPSGVRYTFQGLPLLPEADPWWGTLSTQRLGLQVEYTDSLIGEVLDVLESTGRYDDAILVVAADHGIVLAPESGVSSNGRRLHPDHEKGVRELAWVPMFLKEPGRGSGVVDDSNWIHLDLLPTLADLAGLEVPWETEGISWVREERSTRTKPYWNPLSERTLPGSVFESILADPGPSPLLPEPPHPELVGTAVADLPVLPGDAQGTLARPGRFADVPADGRTVPALVHGSPPPELPIGTPVAIAVNGVVGAVVPVADSEEGKKFAGLVEDYTLFQPGANKVEIFEVVDQGAALRLVATTG